MSFKNFESGDKLSLLIHCRVGVGISSGMTIQLNPFTPNDPGQMFRSVGPTQPSKNQNRNVPAKQYS
jgi:hypothetical protein